MAFPPDETLNVKAGNCIWNVGELFVQNYLPEYYN